MIQILIFINFISLHLSRFTSFPEFYIFPYLASSGWIPYKEIVDQHAPGLFLLPLNFLSFGFSTPEEFKMLSILQMIFISYILFFMGSRIRPNLGLIAVSVYLIFQVHVAKSALWYDSFLPILLLLSLSSLINQRLFLSGVYLGVAFIFKQNSVALGVITFISLLFTHQKHQIKSYLLGLFIPIFLFLIYLFLSGNILEYLYWGFWFNLNDYPSLAHTPLSIKHLAIIIIIISGSAMSLISSRGDIIRRIAFLWVLAMAVTSTVRFDLVHTHSIVPLAALLFSIGIYPYLHISRAALNLLLLVASTLSLAMNLLSSDKEVHNFFSPDTSNQVESISKRVSPGEEVMLIGAQPHLYVLTNTYPPGKYFVFHMPWYLNRTESVILRKWKSSSTKIAAVDNDSSVDGVNIYDSAPNLINYLKDNYSIVDRVGSLDIYEKN